MIERSEGEDPRFRGAVFDVGLDRVVDQIGSFGTCTAQGDTDFTDGNRQRSRHGKCVDFRGLFRFDRQMSAACQDSVVGVDDEGLHVVRDVVARQRHSDRQCDSDLTEGSCHRRGSGICGDRRGVRRLQRDTGGFDSRRAIARDRGMNLRGDFVFREHARTAQADSDVPNRNRHRAGSDTGRDRWC